MRHARRPVKCSGRRPGNGAGGCCSAGDGCTLSSSNVIYFEKNSAGEISSLILRDATGDVNKYGYITSAKTNSGDMNISASYTYFANGAKETINTDVIYSAGVGGATLIYKNGQLKTMRSMKSVNITSLDSKY